MEVKLATKIRREKNENYVEFSFHSISGLQGEKTQQPTWTWLVGGHKI